jgi:O-antigen ligase
MSMLRLCRTRPFWTTAVDVIAILLAASLPWSTSLVGILGLLLLIATVPFLDIEAFLQSIKRPIAFLPIAFFLLALVGTLWSEAPWGERLYAVFPTAKLLLLPVMFYHFERSERGLLVFTAFLVSCTALMAISWITIIAPAFTLKPDASRGIFVKNYIDQSQEFALCAVALAYPVIMQIRVQRLRLALLLGAIGISFIITMAFVVVSRTALVTMPILVAVFGVLHLKWRANLVILFGMITIALIVWAASAQLESTIRTFSRDYQLYTEQRVPTSIGERLEYWKGALRFFEAAPVIGHGTGSARALFERAAADSQWVPGVRVLGNPHNQSLNVAVQWGLLGVAVLYAMWIVHLLLFRGDGLGNWIGLLVVVQNIFTSLFNSHLFDFHEGWMYVLGVGVAGGMVLKQTSEKLRVAEPNPLASGRGMGYQRPGI